MKLKYDFEDYIETKVKPKIKIEHDLNMNMLRIFYIGGRQANDDFETLVNYIKEGIFLKISDILN